MKKLLFLLFTVISFAQTPEQLAQEQLDAYNKKDIEAFLKPYDDNIIAYNFPDNSIMFKGKEEMRKIYSSMFTNYTDLHCTLLNRMVKDNTVIDHESVIIRKGQEPLKARAIYTIENNKITKVHFVE
jgi:hypothetical protein